MWEFCAIVTAWRKAILAWGIAIVLVAQAQVPTPDDFNPGADAWVECFAVAADGSVFVGGKFSMLAGQPIRAIAKLNSQGLPDLSFQTRAQGFVQCLDVLENGQLLIAGLLTVQGNGYPEAWQINIARLHPNGALDLTFRPSVGGGNYPQVLATLVQPDGKIVIGGGFQAVNGVARPHIARLNADGSLDEGFLPHADDWVCCLALAEDDSLVVGGRFHSVDGIACGSLARLRANGELDRGFQARVSGTVETVARDKRGRLIIGGASLSIEGGRPSALARLTPDGTLDREFQLQPAGAVDAVALEEGGGMILSGAFVSVDGLPRSRLVRIDEQGKVDPLFAAGANQRVRAVAIQPDGRILAGGWFTELAGNPRAWLGRLETGEQAAQSWEEQNDGLIWRGSSRSPEISRTQFAYSPDGAVWQDWGPGLQKLDSWAPDRSLPVQEGVVRVRAWVAGSDHVSGWFVEDYHSLGAPVFIVQPTSRAILAGQTVIMQAQVAGHGPLSFRWSRNGVELTDNDRVSGSARARLILSNASAEDVGSYTLRVSSESGASLSHAAALAVNLWSLGRGPTFNHSAMVHALALPPDGGVIAGYMTQNPSGWKDQLRRFDADGREATGFAASADGRIQTLLLRPDGQLRVGGYFDQIDGNPLARFVTLDAGGALKPGVQPKIGFQSYQGLDQLLDQPGGYTLMKGGFTNAGGLARNGWAWLRSDGAVAPSPTQTNVWPLAVLGNGSLLVQEWPGNVPPLTPSHVRILQADGQYQPDFSAEVAGRITCAARQVDGSWVIAGSFTAINGQPRSRLARLFPDGSLDPTFTPQVVGTIATLATLADGRLLIGGMFESVTSQPRSNLAMLERDGTLNGTFAPEPDSAVQALAVDESGTIWVAGSFSSVAGQRSLGIAHLTNAAPANSSFVRDDQGLRWYRAPSAPGFWRVDFDHAEDGRSWKSLGQGSWSDGAWRLDSTTIPTQGSVRARGWPTAGSGQAGWCTDVFAMAPGFSVEPANTTARKDETALFRVVGGGSRPLSFQWWKDGAPLADNARIQGARADTLRIKDLNGSDKGAYSVVVSNEWGRLESRAASLTLAPSRALGEVLDAPYLAWTTGGDAPWLGQASATPGSSENWAQSGELPGFGSSWLETQVEGPGRLSFTWRLDPLSAAWDSLALDFLTNGVRTASAVVHVPNEWQAVHVELGPGPHVLRWVCTEPLDDGYLGGFGRLDAVEFIPTHGAPVFLTQPRGFEWQRGDSDRALTVLVGGEEPCQFQWMKDGELLHDGDPWQGTTSRRLEFPYVSAEFNGTYQVRAMNRLGGVLSESATVRFLDPAVWSSPFAQNCDPGERVRLSAFVDASAPRVFQWYRDGEPIVDGGPISGSGTAELVLSGASAKDAGIYWLVVSNRFGSAQTAEAELRVNLLPPDPTFHAAVGPGLRSIAVQQDGKALLGGFIEAASPTDVHTLLRLQTDGSLDQDFSGWTDQDVLQIGVDAANRILIGGTFLTADTVPRSHLARLDPEGRLDVTFTPPNSAIVDHLMLLPDGRMLIAGVFTNSAGANIPGCRRLLADGRPDPGFSCDLQQRIGCMAVTADGKTLLGLGERYGEPTEILRLHPDGSRDPSFCLELDGRARCLLALPDGRIIAGGEFSHAGGLERKSLCRLLATGEVDPQFEAKIQNGSVSAMALQSDGAILLRGNFTLVGGHPCVGIARVQSDGSLDDTFSPQGIGTPGELAILPDGAFLASYSRYVSPQEQGGVLRFLNPTPTIDRLTCEEGRAMWKRGGSAPQFHSAWFEHSVDGIHWGRSVAGRWTGEAWTAAQSEFSRTGVLRVHGLVSGTSGQWSVVRSVNLLGVDLPRISLAAGEPWIAGETFRLGVVGVPGQSMRLEASDNLEDWLTVTNVVFGADGVSSLQVPYSPVKPARFFRLRLAP